MLEKRFNLVMENYGGLITSIAKKYAKKGQDINDLKQEAYLKIWECLSDYDESVSSMSTYIYIIVNRHLQQKVNPYMEKKYVTEKIEYVDFFEKDYSDNTISLYQIIKESNEKVQIVFNLLSELKTEKNIRKRKTGVKHITKFCREKLNWKRREVLKSLDELKNIYKEIYC